MKLLPEGISKEDVDRWVNRPTRDARTWTLKPGAPRNIVDAFPELIDYFVTPDFQPSETARYDADDVRGLVNMADPSVLMVRLWQLARDTRTLVEVAPLYTADRGLVGKIEELVKEIEGLRDQIHDALLTDEDKANGSVPRAQRRE